jgi:hypothetical protein
METLSNIAITYAMISFPNALMLIIILPFTLSSTRQIIKVHSNDIRSNSYVLRYLLPFNATLL